MTAVLLAAVVLTAGGSEGQVAQRPNIVLLISEDNAVHFMDHFYAGGTEMPKLESLAAEGITFDRVFSNSPVCSVSRTPLINAVYAPRTATHHHRRIELVDMPDGWEMFPFYLREVGYYTVINGKKDFNMIEGEAWDADGPQAHWSTCGPSHEPRSCFCLQ